MSRVKKFNFGLGAMEHLELRVWRAPRRDGLVLARLRGEYAVYCGAGNTHWVDIDTTAAGSPGAKFDTDNLVVACYEHPESEYAPRELGWLMLEWALEGWFDPCDEEPEERVICPVDGVPVGDDGICPDCQVLAGAPCPDCGEPMYHMASCPTLSENPDAPYVMRSDEA